jgi:hypothetical protein
LVPVLVWPRGQGGAISAFAAILEKFGKTALCAAVLLALGGHRSQARSDFGDSVKNIAAPLASAPAAR